MTAASYKETEIMILLPALDTRPENTGRHNGVDSPPHTGKGARNPRPASSKSPHGFRAAYRVHLPRKPPHHWERCGLCHCSRQSGAGKMARCLLYNKRRINYISYLQEQMRLQQRYQQTHVQTSIRMKTKNYNDSSILQRNKK